MKEFSVGVRPRRRKSARKPSNEMRMVVGAKIMVPLEREAGMFFRLREDLETW